MNVATFSPFEQKPRFPSLQNTKKENLFLSILEGKNPFGSECGFGLRENFSRKITFCHSLCVPFLLLVPKEGKQKWCGKPFDGENCFMNSSMGDPVLVTVALFVLFKNDPLSQRPGKLTPTNFPCQFGHQEVLYSHYGARSPAQDKVKLMIRYDSQDDTLIVPVVVNVQVLFEQLEAVTKNIPLNVDKLGGVSNPIDSKVLQFTYDKNVQTCKSYDFKRG
ncbi:FRAS1-related extracellular matrix protein 2 [Caerostris extrusa]|uniref:FRAS1-related extracellular matrix protein 2 n=1 Tax=Caerostris extrusa TaxID=172846 RepID=A0AAV4NNC9_CAEEX|nr:FRAS1-related extracellular matrix protein 2 [Caerostris extrusa]